MCYAFEENQVRKIAGHFGQDFFDKVKRDIETYASRWGLHKLQLVDYFSVNCIFFCSSDALGDVVLKIGRPCQEVYTEFHTLREYAGTKFCKVLDSDIENGVLLEERIRPGVRLRDEASMKKRLNVFSNLYNGLHREPENPQRYPTYVEWVSRITDYMSRRDDHRELYLLMKSAQEICLRIGSSYKREMLLHGDFHHDNILLGDNGAYRIIDPKGVVGDPVFDVPRFILNECDDGVSAEQYCEHIGAAIRFLESSLGIPGSVIKQCFFVETAMANCWMVESDEAPNIESVILAQDIMRSA